MVECTCFTCLPTTSGGLTSCCTTSETHSDLAVTYIWPICATVFHIAHFKSNSGDAAMSSIWESRFCEIKIPILLLRKSFCKSSVEIWNEVWNYFRTSSWTFETSLVLELSKSKLHFSAELKLDEDRKNLRYPHLQWIPVQRNMQYNPKIESFTKAFESSCREIRSCIAVSPALKRSIKMIAPLILCSSVCPPTYTLMCTITRSHTPYTPSCIYIVLHNNTRRGN